MKHLLAALLILLLPLYATAQTAPLDVVKERIDRATKEKTLLKGNYVLDGSLTVITREHKEGITFIGENDTTYPYLRWLAPDGRFMFGLTAHLCKISKGIKYCDEHFSMYRGTTGKDGKVGFWDAEFWGASKGRRDMISVQDSSHRMVDSDYYIDSTGPRPRRFKLVVSDTGVVSAVQAAPGELHDDMEVAK